MKTEKPREKGKFILIKAGVVVALILLLGFATSVIGEEEIHGGVIEIFEISDEVIAIEYNKVVENISLEDSEEINETEEVQDLCSDVDCGISEVICIDNSTVSCENVCNLEDGICNNCVPDCMGHDAEVAINEANQTTEIDEIINLKPILDLEIFNSDNVLRGEVFEVRAVAKISEASANNVSLDWIFPESFKIISGDVTKKCGDLDIEEFCESIIELEVLNSTLLGKDEIKVKVFYGN